MAAGERTVKIRFTGDTKDLDRASKSAEKSLGKFKAGVEAAGRMAIPAAATAAAVLGAAMAPALAGALAAGLVLALGGGVLVAGIMAGMQDAGVAKAFSGLADKAKAAFKDFGKPFIEPLKRAATTFGGALERMAPTVNKLGEKFAPLVDKFAPKLAEMVEKMLPGLAEGAEKSLPFFSWLADRLPSIGAAIGEAAKKIGEFTTWIVDHKDQIAEWIGIIAPIAGIFLGIVAVIRVWIMVQTALNILLMLNPIGLIIIAVAALIAIIVVIATKTDWFQKAWKWAWDKIKAAASAVGSWFKDTLWGKWIKGAWEAIKNKAQDVWNWMKTLPDKFKGAFRKVKDFILNPFKEAFNSIARLWNSTVGQLSWTVPGWVPGIGGNTISVPKLPERASGGPVAAGRAYMVGERGKEVFVPSTSGRIVPNREIGDGFTGDVIIEVDLGNAVKQVIRIENRDLKRRAMARGALA